MQISDSRTCQSNASIFSDSLILLVASQNGRLTTRNTTNHFQQIKDLGLKCIGNVQYLKTCAIIGWLEWKNQLASFGRHINRTSHHFILFLDALHIGSFFRFERDVVSMMPIWKRFNQTNRKRRAGEPRKCYPTNQKVWISPKKKQKMLRGQSPTTINVINLKSSLKPPKNWTNMDGSFWKLPWDLEKCRPTLTCWPCDAVTPILVQCQIHRHAVAAWRSSPKPRCHHQ